MFTDKDEKALQKLEERKDGDGKVKLDRIKESSDVEFGVDQELIEEWDGRGIDHVYRLDRPVTSSEAPEGPPTREIVAQGSLQKNTNSTYQTP